MPDEIDAGQQGKPVKVGVVVKPDDLPIDRFFWFNLSRKWIAGGIQNVIDICGRLKTAISWFFGLGSSGFFVSLFVGNETFKSLDLTLMFIPVLLLLISYALAVFGETVAISRKFEPNEHKSIQAAYNDVMWKSKLFIVSSAVLMLVALTSIPIIFNNAMEKRQVDLDMKAKIKASLVGSYLVEVKNVKGVFQLVLTKVNVTGVVPGAKQLRLIIEMGKSPMKRSVIEEVPVTPDDKGWFSLIVPLSNPTSISADDKVYVSTEFATTEVVEFQRLTKAIPESK